MHETITRFFKRPPVNGENLLAFGIFLLPSLSLTIPTGYSYSAVVLVLGAIAHFVFLPIRYSRPNYLQGPTKLIIFSFVLYAAFWIGDAAMRGEGIRGFDVPSRFIIAAFCLSVIAHTQIKAVWLWLGLGVGSISAGSIAIWQRFIEDIARASGFAPTNKFGLVAITMGLMCLSGLFCVCSQHNSGKRKWLIFIFLLTGFFFGLLAAILSGSRGAWTAVLPTTIVFVWLVGQLPHARRYLLAGIILGFCGVAIIYHSPTTNFADRLSEAAEQIHAYAEGDFTGGVVEYRLEMWKGASILFMEKPYIGWSETGYAARMRALETDGVIQHGTAGYAHAHNDWFNVFAKKGILGGVILLAVYMAPLFFFTKIALHSAKSGISSSSRFALATAGIAFVLSFMSAGLTQVTFNRNIGVMFYGLMTAILAGLLSGRDGAGDTAPHDDTKIQPDT